MESFGPMTIRVSWSIPFEKLRLFDKLEVYVLIHCPLLLGLHVHLNWCLVHIEISVFIEEVLGCP